MVTHHVWVGHANQTVIRDGSTLNEFVARTSSVSAESAESAVLSVSMIPRFSCTPIVSVEISYSTIAATASDLAMTIVLDGQTMNYPAIQDGNGKDVLFTFNSASSEQKKLISTMDVASWATFYWSTKLAAPALSNSSSNAATLAEFNGKIDFSLLGSQKTVSAMEEMCRLHLPLPLKN
jgi:hypothetical protein